MGKNKNKRNEIIPQPKKDEFDVKAILHKLNKYSNGNGMPSSYEYSDHSSTSEVIASSGFTNGFEQTTNKEIKDLHSKLNSDISGLRDSVYAAKDNLNTKISSEIDSVKKDIGIKLDCKVDDKYFYGAISVMLLIGTLIGLLSYLPMIENVKDLNKNNDILKDSIVKINSRIDKIKYTKK